MLLTQESTNIVQKKCRILFLISIEKFDSSMEKDFIQHQ